MDIFLQFRLGEAFRSLTAIDIFLLLARSSLFFCSRTVMDRNSQFVFSERELMFMFAICRRASVCRL